MRQPVALPATNVINRNLNAAFVPQTPTASFVRPRTMLMMPTTVLPHPSRRVRFESIKHEFGSCVSGRNDKVNVICPHVNRTQEPLAKSAGFTDGSLD